MKFAEIIREAGGSPKSFPRASQISVTLYDGKDRIMTSESIHYVEPLFAQHRRAQSNFFKIVEELERTPVDAINVRIDVNSVILYYKTAEAKPFSRKAPLDPMDYD